MEMPLSRDGTTANAAAKFWSNLDEISLRESALCVALKHSAQQDNSRVLCLNSAMYGGIDVGRYLRPQELQDLLIKVNGLQLRLQQQQQPRA